MKKKILAAAACAAMVLSLTACGKGEEPANGISNHPESTVSNNKPDTASTTSTSSAPDTPSTPDQPKEIDWSTVPYADEKDFVVVDHFLVTDTSRVADGVAIMDYLGKNKVVNIPQTVDGKKVVSISSLCNEDITSVNIPNSVTNISNGAFEDCTSLANITIPNSVTKISDQAFRDCTSLTSITIPGSVTMIGNNSNRSGTGAFSGCTSLTSVTILDGVPEIGQYAFENCTSLTSITIPGSVTKINMFAFSSCTSLTSITIPDSVTKISINAFDDCQNIKVTYKGKEYDYDHIDDLYSAINGN